MPDQDVETIPLKPQDGPPLVSREAVPILLVDDQPANLEALEVTLSSSGCRFVQARSADEALLALLEQEFAAIVLDIQMPRISGIELAMLIKRRRRTRHIPILFLTAHMMDEQDALLGYRAGAVDYLTKPISPEILRAKVAVFVDLFRKTQALGGPTTRCSARSASGSAPRTPCGGPTRSWKRGEERTAALREADRRKDDFLAALAHELRNPMAAIRSAFEVLRLRVQNPVLDAPRGVIDRQLKHMKRLIDDLLDVSRITRDQLKLQTAPVELAAVIKQAIETSQPIIDQRQQALTVRLPQEPVFLEADLVRLSQVFSNLLDNAAKYSDPGGTIEVFAETAGEQVYVHVADTGIGIERSALPDLFEPFKQVESTGRGRNGLGIGLSLVRRLVELHGGGVVGRSEGPGKGSEFVVRLPILAGSSDVMDATGREDSTAALNRSLRVLIVEDNRDAAGMVNTLLSGWGQDTRLAHEPHAALQIAEEFRPQVVLLDIGLPKMHGYDLARRMRDTRWGKKAVIVAVTGWGQEADRQQSKAAGIDYHLLKPLDRHGAPRTTDRTRNKVVTGPETRRNRRRAAGGSGWEAGRRQNRTICYSSGNKKGGRIVLSCRLPPPTHCRLPPAACPAPLSSGAKAEPRSEQHWPL